MPSLPDKCSDVNSVWFPATDATTLRGMLFIT